MRTMLLLSQGLLAACLPASKDDPSPEDPGHTGETAEIVATDDDRFSGSLEASVTFTALSEIDAHAGLDLDGDGRAESVVVGESSYSTWSGALELLDQDGLRFLVQGAQRGDALGYLPAIRVADTLIVSAVNADLGGTDAGAIYAVIDGALGAPVYGNGASGAVSAYNGSLAALDDGRILAGFPTFGGEDDGAAFVFSREALEDGGLVSAVASLQLASARAGGRLGARVASLDLDGDGSDELLVADDDGVYVVPATLSGSLTISSVAVAMVPVPEASWLGGGDLDGDGTEDLALISGGALQVISGPNAIDGGTERLASLSDVAYALVTDLDGDGISDLVWTTSAGELGPSYGPLDGDPSAEATLSGALRHLSVADLDQDGAMDVLVSVGSAEIWGVMGVLDGG